jgi:hypothetical protein
MNRPSLPPLPLAATTPHSSAQHHHAKGPRTMSDSATNSQLAVIHALRQVQRTTINAMASAPHELRSMRCILGLAHDNAERLTTALEDELLQQLHPNDTKATATTRDTPRQARHEPTNATPPPPGAQGGD